MELSSRQKKLSYTVCGIYLFLLTWLILFKFQIDIAHMPLKRNINLIPFAQPKMVGGRVDISEMLYNVGVFVPLGVYVSIFFGKMKFWQKIMLPLGLSVLYEALQFIFAIGLSDMTDVITNTVGGVLGLLLFLLLSRLLRDKTVKVINVIGLVGEGLALVLLAIVTIGNL